MNNHEFITTWQEIHTIVDEGMEKRDRFVSIYISPDGSISVCINPVTEEEERETHVDV